MSALPQVDDESRIVGIPLPPRNFGREFLQYGAFQLAARYCGLSGPAPHFEGEWQHGWNPSDTVHHPELITSTDGLSRHRRETHTFLVARDDEAKSLTQFGYRSAHAVGLPIVYQPAVQVDRLPGSLLVMPVHSLEYTQHAWNFEQYADEVEALRDRFSRVVVCVSTSCFKRGYWVPAFERRGIPVVSGADIFDGNTYGRLACLFSRFEFMTTNGFGSHLVYAGVFGAKPSIHGTVALFQRKDFQSDAYYRHNPDVLDIMLDVLTPESLRRRFPHLFVQPWEAADQTEWAGFQVGVQHRRTPDVLRNLLGWNRSSRRTPGLKSITAKVTGRAHRLAARIADPETHEQTAAIAALKKATTGRPVQSDLPCPGFESADGPRLAWELEKYFYGEAFRILVNPPEGPAVDLTPRDGVSVLALARHHSERPIWFLDPEGEQGVLLRKNLACADTKSKIAGVTDLQSVAGNAVVVRLAVDATNWHEAAATISQFPGCRLLFLEGTGNSAEYFAPLLKTLTDLRFLPRLDRFLFSSVGESGFLATRTVFSLPLTRSGLDLQA